MRAIQLHEFGPAENLVLEHLEDLVPGPGHRLGDLAPELVVDYGEEGWTDRVTALGGVDLVYDGVGGDLGRADLEGRGRPARSS